MTKQLLGPINAFLHAAGSLSPGEAEAMGYPQSDALASLIDREKERITEGEYAHTVGQ